MKFEDTFSAETLVLERLAKHFETKKYGNDKYLFPDEIASEIRDFAADLTDGQSTQEKSE